MIVNSVVIAYNINSVICHFHWIIYPKCVMRRVNKIISSILVCSISYSIVWAISDSWLILRNFKAQEREMLFESDRVLLDEDDRNILSTYNRIWIYENIGQNIQSKREYLESQNEKITGRVNSLQASVDQLDTEILDLVWEVNKINARVIETKNQVDLNVKSIELLSEKVSESTEILLEYMVYLYKKWEFVSSGNDIDNLKSILLSEEKIDELVNDLHFKGIIQISGQQLIETHRNFISSLYIKKIELQKQENTLRALRKQGILEKSILDDKKAAKQRLLEVTQWQEQLYQKYIDDKLAIERDVKVKELQEQIKLNNTKRNLLDKYSCDFVALSENNQNPEELLGLSQQCQDINKIIYAESRLTGTVVWNNPFDWPVSPALWISAYYRDDEYIEAFGTDHDAIDIVVPQGTEIKAPMDGYVLYLQPPVSTGYAYVALKHSDGLVSLYGHISESLVGRYDFVKKGEVFAISWGEFGTPWAWVLTTWPHLHFVVYENEEYSDPLEYLDTSFLQYASLPEKYNFKYLTDFKTRRGYDYKSNSGECERGVFCIEWDTEIDRQKFLLNTYAVWAFRNWDIWVDESIAQWIDPTFVMCIGLAETTLWKYLKTPNNIGNIWNTDSWSTITFPTPRSGVAAMARAFNNRFLGDYTEIQELSRYGNKTGSIYASSEFNWHNNIIKCMSHVKWEYIPDNYNFRLQ